VRQIGFADLRQAKQSRGNKERLDCFVAALLAMTTKNAAFQLPILRRHLPQTLAAQAVPARHRHRQTRGFFRAPARAIEAATEFRSASRAGEAARHRREFF